MAISKQIISGRAAVAIYRAAHAQLSVGKIMTTASVARAVSDGHTPLLDTLTKAIVALGFKSLDAFFTASYDADTADGIKDVSRWQ
jgi:DNA-binding phage protein